MEIIHLAFFFTLDPLYFLMIAPAILLAIFAQMRVKSAYNSMSKVGTARGYSGAQAANRIMESAGITDVTIERVQGWLSDHYDPRNKVLRLSPGVFDGQSIASVGIAAHEAGHALQHAQGYAPLQIRSLLVPAASIGSWLAWPMIIFGSIMGAMGLTRAGIILFAALVLFQIITLPVEFNASSRAKLSLADTGIVVNNEEMSGVSSVLNAAAMTYVAATVAAIAQLLYFLLRSGLLRR